MPTLYKHTTQVRSSPLITDLSGMTSKPTQLNCGIV